MNKKTFFTKSKKLLLLKKELRLNDVDNSNKLLIRGHLTTIKKIYINKKLLNKNFQLQNTHY